MTRLAAHRGGALLWPENSLRAFRESLVLGVDLLELDVHLTADGRAAVIHDATLERTTDGAGPVSARTARELARVRLRGPDGALTDEHVPTLEDVLELLAPSRTGLLLEVKGAYPELVARAVERVRDASMLDRVNVMGFNPDVVEEARALAPAVATTFLVAAAQVRLAEARAEDAVEWARRLGATDVGLEHTLAGEPVMRAARAAGLRVGVWTVNDEPTMRRVITLGVDVLTTDRPDLGRRVLGR